MAICSLQDRADTLGVDVVTHITAHSSYACKDETETRRIVTLMGTWAAHHMTHLQQHHGRLVGLAHDAPNEALIDAHFAVPLNAINKSIVQQILLQAGSVTCQKLLGCCQDADAVIGSRYIHL